MQISPRSNPIDVIEVTKKLSEKLVREGYDWATDIQKEQSEKDEEAAQDEKDEEEGDAEDGEEGGEKGEKSEEEEGDEEGGEEGDAEKGKKGKPGTDGGKTEKPKDEDIDEGDEGKPSEPVNTEQQVKNDLDKQFDKDMGNIDAAIKSDMNAIMDTLVYTEARNVYIPAPTLVNLKNSLVNVFKKLKKELQVRYVREQTRGRLSIPSIFKEHRRIERGGVPSGKVFQQRIAPKAKSVRMGLVILLDESGSMGEEYKFEGMKATGISIARDTAWAIASAVEEDNGFAAIIGFATQEILRKEFRKVGEHLEWQRGSRTFVSNAILMGEHKLMQLFKQQDIDNLVLVIITDGQFADRDEQHPAEVVSTTDMKGHATQVWGSTLVRALISGIKRKRLIKTIMIHIEDKKSGGFYGTDYLIEFQDFAQLPRHMSAIIERIQMDRMREAVKKAGG